MTAEHHYQRVDFENGYIEATRDDTDEMQDLRVKAYLPDGTLIQESRLVYNIQYDYCRRQDWKSGVMIVDDIIPHHAYGHLQWEFSLQPPPPAVIKLSAKFLCLFTQNLHKNGAVKTRR